MRSSFVKAVVAGSMLAGLSALPALAAVQARGRAEGRDDHLRAEERRRLVAGLRRGPPAHGEVDGDHDPLRRERAGERDRHPAAGRALHRQGLQHHHRQRLRLLRHVQGARRASIPNVAFLNGAGITNGAEPRIVLRPHLRDASISAAWPPRAASKTGKLGFVAANPFGLVNWTVNAYRARRASRSIRTPPPP